MELQVFQSMWGMEQLPWRAAVPWTVDEQVEMIHAAGYSGLAISFSDRRAALEVCSLARARDLRVIALAFPGSVDELDPILELVAEVGRERVDHVNVQPNVQPFTVSECIPYLEGWAQRADDAGVRLLIETHRGRMTNDLLFTVQLLETAPWLELAADLSHFVVGREFTLPVDAKNQAHIRHVLDHARAFHGRVASREQVQVQSGFPQHAVWLNLFTEWWEEGFRRFHASAAEEAVLTFTPELGPPSWYAMTDANGDELSDRWEEALSLARLARRIWSDVSETPIREETEMVEQGDQRG